MPLLKKNILDLDLNICVYFKGKCLNTFVFLEWNKNGSPSWIFLTNWRTVRSYLDNRHEFIEIHNMCFHFTYTISSRYLSGNQTVFTFLSQLWSFRRHMMFGKYLLWQILHWVVSFHFFRFCYEAFSSHFNNCVYCQKKACFWPLGVFMTSQAVLVKSVYFTSLTFQWLHSNLTLFQLR